MLVALIVASLMIFIGVKVIPVRVSAYEFKDVLRTEVRYGAVRDDDSEVKRRILAKAEELEVPIKTKDVKIKRTAGWMTVTAKYEHPIDLKFYTYVYTFNAEEKAPLF